MSSGKKKEAEMELGRVSNAEGKGEGEGEEEGDHRQWGNQLDFLMSCISYAVGLGNIWRFPYKVYKNGGGAFLIPYFICWLLVGVPMFFFETALGQQFKKGGVGVWNVVPIFKGFLTSRVSGIGIASLMMATLVSIYYAVVIAWALLYLFSSFTATLPWRNCGHSWNTALCINESVLMNPNFTKTNASETASNQFWTNRVLGISESIEESGSIQWMLLATLTLSWIAVYLIIWKGLHSSGKIVWFTALFPYVLIFTLLGWTCTLEGASYGLSFYIKPDISMLGSATVWVDAATQVMYSYGIGFSSLIAMGCYNKYNHNNQRDALIVGVINSGTSLLAGVVVFGSLGFAATKRGLTIHDVAEQGPGLIFQVYPQIFLEMPVSPLWSIVFFFMVLVLGIDSQFCQVEGVMAGLEDQWPKLFKEHKRKLTLAVCAFCYVLAWPQIDKGGIYLFQLMDSMAASGPALLWVVFWEAVAICWIYGYKKFFRGLDHMYAGTSILKYTRYWWWFCWVVMIPVICVGVFLFSIINYEPVTYNKKTYPAWGEALGWMMSLASMVMIPGYAIFYLLTTSGTFQERLNKGITPTLTPPYLKEEETEPAPPPYDVVALGVTLSTETDLHSTTETKHRRHHRKHRDHSEHKRHHRHRHNEAEKY